MSDLTLCPAVAAVALLPLQLLWCGLFEVNGTQTEIILASNREGRCYEPELSAAEVTGDWTERGDDYLGTF